MNRAIIIYCFCTVFLTCCDNSSNEFDDIKTVIYRGNSDFTIRETSLSVNNLHKISTCVTNNSGMGIIVDGERLYFDDFAVRYSPVISDNGVYAYARQQPGVGYDIIVNDRSVLHSSVCLDYLNAGSNKAICVESDNGNMNLYVIDMITGDCNCIKKIKNEYIEDICRYGTNQFGMITSMFASNGNKEYNLYKIDGINSSFIKVIDRVNELIAFPQKKDNNLYVDFIQIQDNERYLYNAIKLAYDRETEAFAKGNDFRGRMSWDQSERLRGLSELYKKTQYADIRDRIINIVDGIMNARNRFCGVLLDEFNPGFLWSSKCYTLNYEPASIIINNCEIMSSLLYVVNEGILQNNEIVKNAKELCEFYSKWYSEGNYYLPHSLPTNFDGIVVPWNYQSSMAEVYLGLYIETGEKRYLDHCNELMLSFMREWVQTDERIYWHYWPLVFYEGWEDDGRSNNTPFRAPQEDYFFEDISHAGISVRLLSRYIDVVTNGVVDRSHLKKIETNMKYFCHLDGFSRFISGDESYSPRVWHYWVSPYFAYLKNSNFEKYVKQGYLNCFPEWDSQESLFANAKLYDSNIPHNDIIINRYIVLMDGLLESASFTCSIDEIRKLFE